MDITLPKAPSLPVVDDQGAAAGAFPVGRIFCVGRNYGDHAREMGHDPELEPPFFFSKFASSLSLGPDHALPAFSEDVHHEVELVLALGSRLQNATEAEALEAVVAAGAALDLTARDRQAEAKAAGRPWLVAKGFDGAAPCGALAPLAASGVTFAEGDLPSSVEGFAAASAGELVESNARGTRARSDGLASEERREATDHDALADA